MLAIESMSGVGRSGAKPRYSSVTFAKSDCNCREARNQTAIDAAERFSPIFVALPKFRLQMSQAAPEDCKYSALIEPPSCIQFSLACQSALHVSQSCHVSRVLALCLLHHGVPCQLCALCFVPSLLAGGGRPGALRR
jgi:hypothetical protein